MIVLVVFDYDTWKRLDVLSALILTRFPDSWIDVEMPSSREPRPMCNCSDACGEDCLNRFVKCNLH